MRGSSAQIPRYQVLAPQGGPSSARASTATATTPRSRSSMPSYGRAARRARARPGWPDALVVFSADHGESLGEQRLLVLPRRARATVEAVRVPLIVRYPRGDARPTGGARGRAAPHGRPRRAPRPVADRARGAGPAGGRQSRRVAAAARAPRRARAGSVVPPAPGDAAPVGRDRRTLARGAGRGLCAPRLYDHQRGPARGARRRRPAPRGRRRPARAPGGGPARDPGSGAPGQRRRAGSPDAARAAAAGLRRGRRAGRRGPRP